ncbi:hypothetical protein [Thiolinea disciformis]|uniref:hypothetical protein n=1 Tax=Thiolinea disciformis TaxID=125614 RepID=UPI00037B2046|nr:hypothetical protein [Thiolinea disciformis]
MLDIILNFLIALIIIGIPSYAFYRVGKYTGIQHGMRRQLLRDLTLSGIVQIMETKRSNPFMKIIS